FNAGPPRITAPRAYTVEVSLDGKKWTKVAEGESKSNNSVIAFAPVKAKFVRMNQTGKAEDGSVWSMQTLKFFEIKDAATAKK
ncbi:MAG TPA: discoidin domain-containing protein, partial [Cyclobacteriaceae bacterium]|nr:discoidin domain-containing protein [Cyclobacteriaceae bacterium]